MATKKVDFEVTPKDGTQAYWIAVDEDDVTLVNGRGSINVDDKIDHLLIWWFTGNAGGKLSIVGKVGQKTVVEVKESKIPKGKTRGAGKKDIVF